MEMQWADARYWTTTIVNDEDGFSGCRLHQERNGKPQAIADMIFWDAMGQYFLRTYGGRDVPLNVIEALITETKNQVGV
jgi:hypothetical protein